MKISFLLVSFVFYFLLFPLVAQEGEYTILETELLKLEKISENLETNKHNQQLQVQNLKLRLTEALKKSESLRGQLQMEREISKNLRQSYEEYEREVNTKIEEYKVLIDKLTEKLHRVRIAIVIISCLFIFLILGNIIFFILKMKLKFL